SYSREPRTNQFEEGKIMEPNSLKPFITGLGSVSLQAAIIVAAILLAQFLFRKQLSPRWRCGLWLLVLLRLVFPFSPTSALSIFNLIPQWTRPLPESEHPVPTPAQVAREHSSQEVTLLPLRSPPVANQLQYLNDDFVLNPTPSPLHQ